MIHTTNDANKLHGLYEELDHAVIILSQMVASVYMVQIC